MNSDVVPNCACTGKATKRHNCWKQLERESCDVLSSGEMSYEDVRTYTKPGKQFQMMRVSNFSQCSQTFCLLVFSHLTPVHRNFMLGLPARMTRIQKKRFRKFLAKSFWQTIEYTHWPQEKCISFFPSGSSKAQSLVDAHTQRLSWLSLTDFAIMSLFLFLFVV